MLSYLLLYLGLALGVSFLCSILEATLMSTTLSYLTMLEQEGDKAATRMLGYKNATEKPLAAILSLNTIANTVGAAGVGQQATAVFGSQWFGVVSAVVTLLILIVSEIIPKTIGTTYWKQLTRFASGTIRVLIIVMYPMVLLIHAISRLFPQTEETSVSREEVVALASVGEEEGVIDQDEKKIIRNIIRLDDVKAKDVMTPRVVAAVAPESMTLHEYYEDETFEHFSRIPVYAETPEYITGYIMRDDALENLADDRFDRKLGDIKRSLPQFPETMSVGDIFDRMLHDKSQIAIAIDEYGCFRGILTLEDVIETIFGLEIVDENDEYADMQQYARERWVQRQKRFKKL